jgi:hypothetical protein
MDGCNFSRNIGGGDRSFSVGTAAGSVRTMTSSDNSDMTKRDRVNGFGRDRWLGARWTETLAS